MKISFKIKYSVHFFHHLQIAVFLQTAQNKIKYEKYNKIMFKRRNKNWKDLYKF